MDPKRFVADLNLAYPEFTIDSLEPFNPFKSAEEAATSGEEEGYINNKSIISFVSNVSGQNRQDVLNSVLLAQLVADFKVPLTPDITEEQLIQWYEEFIKVLNGVGWVNEKKEFSKFDAGESIFEMENVIFIQ